MSYDRDTTITNHHVQALRRYASLLSTLELGFVKAGEVRKMETETILTVRREKSQPRRVENSNINNMPMKCR